MHEKGYEMNNQLTDRRFELDGMELLYRPANEQMTWGEGNIVRPQIDEQQEDILFEAFKSSLIKVDPSKLAMSGCTDGRFRMQMMDGSEAPVLQKNVGCDIIEMFVAAEVLGSKFYGSDTDRSDINTRFRYLMGFMKESGLKPTTHVGCGARNGLVPVVSNFVKYASDELLKGSVISRISEFSDESYSLEELDFVVAKLSERRLDKADYDPDSLQNMIVDFSGHESVKELLDDGHGVHGHTEASIDHIFIPGYAFSTRKYREELEITLPELAQIERFTVNDDRNIDLAKKIADTDSDRRLSLIAINGFADAGHATLSSGLPTNIVRLAA
jgi:hypothetical protein